jgi:hypothetical protein
MSKTEGLSSAVSTIGKLNDDGSNFSMWKGKVLAALDCMDVLSAIEQPPTDVPRIRMSIGSSSIPRTPVKSVSEADVSATATPQKNSLKESDEVKLEKLKQGTGKSKSKVAYLVLICTLNQKTFRLVQHVPRGDAYAVWQLLLNRFESKTIASVMNTRRKIREERLDPHEPFDDYMGRLNLAS